MALQCVDSARLNYISQNSLLSFFNKMFLVGVSHKEASWEMWRPEGKRQSFCGLHTWLLMYWLASLVRSSSSAFPILLCVPDLCARCVCLPLSPRSSRQRQQELMCFSPSLNTNTYYVVSVHSSLPLVAPTLHPFFLLDSLAVDVKFQHPMQKSLRETAYPTATTTKVKSL